MRTRSSHVVFVGLLGVAVLACGTSSDGPTDSEQVDESLPDASDLIEEADTAGVSALTLALDRTADAAAFRVSFATAQTMRAPALGIDIEQSLDPSNPSSVTEVAANGAVFTTVELDELFVMAPGLEVDLLMWQDDETLVIDLTDYEQLLEFDPSLATSPFRPGMVTVDLARAKATGITDLAELIAGQSPPSPGQLAVSLRSAAIDAEQSATDPNRFRFETTAARYVEAMGQDLEVAAESMAVGLSTSLGVDSAGLQTSFIETYRSAPSTVEVSIDESGVDTVRFDSDLTSFWAALGDLNDLDPAMFADAELSIDVVVDFDLDDTIDVVFPEGDFEDRTDELIALFADG